MSRKNNININKDLKSATRQVIIPVIAKSRELFDQYLSTCGKALMERLDQTENIDVFRQEVRGILENKSQQEQLLGILGGMNAQKCQQRKREMGGNLFEDGY